MAETVFEAGSVAVLTAANDLYPRTSDSSAGYYASRQVSGIKVSNPTASKYYRIQIGDVIVYEVVTGATAPTSTIVDRVNIITGGKQLKLVTDDAGTAFKVFLYF